LPAPLPPRNVNTPRIKTPAPRAEVPPLATSEESQDAATVPSASLSASPSAAPGAPKGGGKAAAPSAAPQASAPAPAPTPWVKPEWARPDEEPAGNDDDPYK